ncbi:hypothetical protein QFC22_005036 [Naganishia vaughanmartiniae]|uniref:Uncharacterized protein n=1 Tax=Naganishia vaughanmartiniae TaxID=1424756 RepID=A0ACC2WWQ4_9TREE|nr:hypothetical protein QFC22_005036 [Naganishia vaughanmartiniae]
MKTRVNGHDLTVDWFPDGHVHEFPYIRIDSFSQSSTPGFPAAQFYLLTHAHTDHLTGLDSASTNIIIICSAVTKGLVLNYERERDRIAFDKKTVEKRKRVYEGLAARVESVNKEAAGHRGKHETFLLTDPDKDLTVLHTGDIRPDRPFLDRLERHPAVMPFLARFMGMDVSQQDHPSIGARLDPKAQAGIFRNKKLERIYLDTSAIHVDRWRYLNYQNVVDDPLLLSLCTTYDRSTRFHTCERHNQCASIQAAFTQGSGKRVVSIEFIEEKAVEHAIKMQEVQKECLLAMQGKGDWPTKLYCPLARHATLPELQALLDLFRPKTMSPNTLLPFLKGADYYAMIAAFGDCLAADGKEELRKSCLRWFRKQKGLKHEADVWSFARETLLFQGAPQASGQAEADVDLRAGRNANRQRQSESFLPTLPFATKSTLNSPKADMIPREPTIAISPSKLSQNEEDVPVFGKTDVHGYIQEYLAHQENLMDEDDQDTQVQKSRESRSERSAKSVLAERGYANRQVNPSTESDLDQGEPQSKRYIIFDASRDPDKVVKPSADVSKSTPAARAFDYRRTATLKHRAHSSPITRLTAKSSSGILLGPKTTPIKSKETIQ